MQILVPVLMVLVGFVFFRWSFRRSKQKMDTEVRDVF
jgi:nitrogen fixation-related uncharacterized protein